jgi:lipid-binding SYLF domain-containing protein
MMKYSFLAAIALAVGACGPSPSSPANAMALEDQANATLKQMYARAPGLRSFVDSSAGVAVFPNVGAAGAFVAGGAYGKGVLYENGYPIGYVNLSSGSLGPQLGGQSFSELIVLRSHYDVQQMKAGSFKFGAEASAVVLNAGAAVGDQIAAGRTVYVEPRGGLMAGLSVSGQQINFAPRG